MIQTHRLRLALAIALTSAIFALLFYDQGFAIPDAGGELALIGVWFSLFAYSAILFAALGTTLGNGLQALPLTALRHPAIWGALAWLAATCIALPGVAFMTVSVERFQPELDPLPVSASASTAEEFIRSWTMEVLDIAPTSGLFFVVLTAAAWFGRGITLADSRSRPADLQERAETAPVIPHLDDRPIWALQADEHYVLVHGPNGTQQVLGRFKDALEDVVQRDGLQVHRSWWISREGIDRVDNQPKQSVVYLKSGIQIQVSQRRQKPFEAWHASPQG